MSIELPFANNTVATYAYEPFSYTISNPPPGTYTLTTSNSSGIPPGTLVNTGFEVVFSSPSNSMTPGLTSEFVITAKDGDTIVATSSNTVTVGAGRFLDGSGNSFAGRSVGFFKNEPITPIPLVAPFAISDPTSVPTLPPGLTYVSNASNSYTITGTPLVTVPQSNYLVIGKAIGSNLGKIVTAKFGLSVSNERILTTLTGAPIVDKMTIGTPISQLILSSQYPPYPSGGTLRYTWFGLPDGITVLDTSGTLRTSPATFTDSAATLTIQGAPTMAAAESYRNAGITSNIVTFTATRTSPLPALSNTTPITFPFGETVLFDTPPAITLYSGVMVDPSAISFRAQTYFGTGSSITSMFSPDLRADLSINFVPAQGRGYLTSILGGPGTTATASYTIKAVNSSDISQSIVVPITVAADTVTFVAPLPVDASYNFVLSRPIADPLPGFPGTIEFRAVAASGKPVTFSAPSFAGTGLSLTTLDANTVRLTGTPEAVRAQTTTTITASAVGTPASATTPIKFEILDDVITLSQPSPLALSFIQNRLITPIQLTATTLSGRSVISFTSTTMPSGLVVSTTGQITGTHLGATVTPFTITASTGYASGSKTYTYTLTPDSLIFVTQKPSYTYAPLSPVSIPVLGLTYSGLSVSNYAFSGFSPSYGVSIEPTTGEILGTFQSGVPPDPLFPRQDVSFSITGSAASLSGTLPSTFSVSNPVVSRTFLLSDALSNVSNAVLFTNDDDTYSVWASGPTGGTSLALKNTSVDSNVYLLPSGENTYRRSTDGVNWTPLEIGAPGGDTLYTAFYSATASKWYAAGTRLVEFSGGVDRVNALFTSSNDGLTWSVVSVLDTAPRQDTSVTNYFTSKGVALGSNSGVLLLGGGYKAVGYVPNSNTIQRSTNGGRSWAMPSSWFFDVEVGSFALEGARWVAAGSSDYSSGSTYSSFSTPATTLQWSDDQGAGWSKGTGSGHFNVTATQVVYAGGRWLATGLNAGTVMTGQKVVTGLSYSADGDGWSPITLPGITFGDLDAEPAMPLPEVNSIWSDSTNWYVLVRLQVTAVEQVFQHALTGDLTTGWTVKSSSLPVPGSYSHGLTTNYVRLGIPTTLRLAFASSSPNGPVFTSPTQLSYVLYQYVQISPIVLSATGTGFVYYFVVSSQLPLGVTFDPITATFSGAPMRLGQSSFVVYAKDEVGVSQITISINSILPSVVRQQTSAGAWTSLIRQYTEVNAAQNSINGKALPATEPPLGEFLRPSPPDVVNDTTCPKC